MTRTILLIICVFCCACANERSNTSTVVSTTKTSEIVSKSSSNSNTIDATQLKINRKPKGNYNTIKQTIATDRAYFAKQFKQNKQKTIDSASSYLYNKLLNEIVPHWYGTPWDFNGHTNIPNEGEIACGYFVSTTLKHLGFRLNRYKMAQEGGTNEAITLQPRAELKIYRNISQTALKTKLNNVYKDGIYFVGLSNHVGYVLIKNKELYFLHSSYCDNKVILEKAETSPCFQSDIYVFAEITTNRKLIQKWIQNTPIPIHK
ncbi:hypothetical protein IMCC3317_44190 [Kordia antarctica]|uniref:NlpC/P60 domain-containing protein n=1 Tax=Kordia antarctica TaxID=1218801 RepID=A0A7L4ZRB0_9FLAO|nr:hypothetical protein [Kordia antarctica]QHI39019.1 hypothetical protein IMCC3317_44190 [Kordia antarctica]